MAETLENLLLCSVRKLNSGLKLAKTHSFAYFLPLPIFVFELNRKLNNWIIEKKLNNWIIEKIE